MQKIRNQALIIFVTIIFVVIIMALILEPPTIQGKNINEISKENAGLIWAISLTGLIIVFLFQYLIYGMTALNNKLTKENTLQNTEIINTLKNSFAQYEEFRESLLNIDERYMEKWSDVKENIIAITKRLDQHSQKIQDLQNGK